MLEVIQYLKSNDAKREIESKFKREAQRIEEQVSKTISKAMGIHVHGGVNPAEVGISLKKQMCYQITNKFAKI